MAYPKLMTAKAVYDFGIDEGAVSTITPANGGVVPNNAIITKAYSVVTTAMAGSGATLALAVGGVAIVAATAFDNGIYDDEDVTEYDVADKTTSSGQPTFTVGSAVLTAGVVELYIQYYITAESVSA